ncbi:MAG: glycosyltransferase family 9 protein [Actinomycetota bacterium]|nr:glycosyltransferase family 9 protein [Actinomycetota bacterium]
MRNLLAMRLDNLGDVLMTGPALRAIREALPQARITLMASPGGAQAAPLLPWIDQVLSERVVWQDVSGRLTFDPEREGRLVARLSEKRFDASVIFTSFNQTPHAAAYLCYLAAIPLRLGASKERGRAVLTNELSGAPDSLHQVERNLRLVESVGFTAASRHLSITLPSEARQRCRIILEERGVHPRQPFLLLNPWTSCQARTYPWQRFGEAARLLVAETGWRVVVTGVERDRLRSRELVGGIGRAAVDMTGRTSFPELACLVDASSLVLTNNTSVMHLADATATPAVITFSGTELESQWRPRRGPAVLLRHPTSCSPCYAFTCPFNLECLDIPAREVAEAALQLLGSGRPSQVRSQ